MRRTLRLAEKKARNVLTVMYDIADLFRIM